MRALALAAVAAALFVLVPGVAAADPATNVLPVELTCGADVFDLVVPANGRAAPGLFRNSTSVAVLKGVEGVFMTPGFTEDKLTRCTAEFPDGVTITVFVLITPRR